jgi:hypothetical protein
VLYNLYMQLDYIALEVLTEGLNMYQKASTYDRRSQLIIITVNFSCFPLWKTVKIKGEITFPLCSNEFILCISSCNFSYFACITKRFRDNDVVGWLFIDRFDLTTRKETIEANNTTLPVIMISLDYIALEVLTEGLNMYQKASTYDRRSQLIIITGSVVLLASIILE